LINRIMNPRLDDPDAQMPNLGILRPEAEIIADKLLGISSAHSPPSKLGALSSLSFLRGPALGAFLGAGVGLAQIVRKRRKAPKNIERG
jgi:hypothetical protein